MSSFEVIKRQPNFPNEDLDEKNVPIMEFFLRDQHEATTHAKFLGESMRPLHLTAHYALELSGVEVDYTPAEYDAFCKGFAAFEYVSLMVNPRHVREQLVARNVHRLLTATNVFPELEVAERRQAWINGFPNVNDVLTGVSVKEGETLPQLYSRTIGAQMAWEFQKAA